MFLASNAGHDLKDSESVDSTASGVERQCRFTPPFPKEMALPLASDLSNDRAVNEMSAATTPPLLRIEVMIQQRLLAK